jgi:hypothetical protein
VLISGIMTGMVDKSRSVNGVPTSLKDLGYIDVGLGKFYAHPVTRICAPARHEYHHPNRLNA